MCRKLCNSVALNPDPRTPADKIVNGAKNEIIRGVFYDASYQQMPYPNGDVKSDRGACSDVVIRALRNAGYDLQKLIHEDMKSHFSAYPHNWGLNATDPNIDHRRVPNQMTFFRRHGRELPTGTTGENFSKWKPGDIVCWKLDGRLDHTGIISDVKGKSGLPMVIHNLGRTAQEDCLNNWKITGHFRYPAH